MAEVGILSAFLRFLEFFTNMLEFFHLLINLELALFYIFTKSFKKGRNIHADRAKIDSCARLSTV